MIAKAAISDGCGKFYFGSITLGEPAPNEILVEIKASGVCHTDYDHLNHQNKTYVMGHEGAGLVLQTGKNVSTIKTGDRVLLNWAIPCGECFQCMRGAENICENRPAVRPENRLFRGEPINASFGLGTMATHAIVPKQAAVKINVEIPFSSAAILGCGVMTGFGSVINAAKVAPGSSVVVLGTGGVGLSVIQAAVYAKAAKIIAVDVNPNRLELARVFGATEIVLPDTNDVDLLQAAQKIKEITDGRGADYAFECTAVPALGSAPLAMIRNGGTAVGVSGIEQKISFDMELFEWDKSYINPLYGQCRPQIDFPLLLNLYAYQQLKLTQIRDRRMSGNPAKTLGIFGAEPQSAKTAH